MIRFVKYNNELKEDWNEFVIRSKNGTFLFNRNYMDYHSDRFKDHSLLVYYNDTLTALLPANEKDNSLISHGGLTYGGLITSDKINTPKMLDVFLELKSYLADNNLQSLIYKVIPHIYHSKPAEEDVYALFINNAELIKREVSSSVYLLNHKTKSKKANGARKAEKEGLWIEQSEDFEAFFEVVNNGLKAKYNVSAVHSADEMKLLQYRFPENIKLFGTYLNDKLVGGAIIYETATVAHAQYLASSQEARKLRAMDLIVVCLLNHYADKKLWLDFGISTENAGRYLNENLIKQKEEFGASAVNYDTYELRV